MSALNESRTGICIWMQIGDYQPYSLTNRIKPQFDVCLNQHYGRGSDNLSKMIWIRKSKQTMKHASLHLTPPNRAGIGVGEGKNFKTMLFKR